MSLIKNVFKIFAVTAFFASANVFAADFLVDTTINDANDDAIGGWKYEIDNIDSGDTSWPFLFFLFAPWKIKLLIPSTVNTFIIRLVSE